MAARRPRTSPPTTLPLDAARDQPMPDPPGKLHPSKGPYVPPEPGAPLLERIERVERHLDGFPCPGCQDGVGLFGAWRRAIARGDPAAVLITAPFVVEAPAIDHSLADPYERMGDFIAALRYVMGRPGLTTQTEIIDAVGDLVGRADAGDYVADEVAAALDAEGVTAADLIAQGSLGTPAAQALAARTPDATAEAIVARVDAADREGLYPHSSSMGAPAPATPPDLAGLTTAEAIDAVTASTGIPAASGGEVLQGAEPHTPAGVAIDPDDLPWE